MDQKNDSEQCLNQLKLDLISLLVNFLCELKQVQWALQIKTIHFARWMWFYNAGGLKGGLLQWQIVLWDISQWFYMHQISCLGGLIKLGPLYTTNFITCIMLTTSQYV